MLHSTHRFHGHGSLRYVYKNGFAVRSSALTLRYCKNTRRKSARFAVVISKKTLKSAVGRNRVRRRIYEIIRAELPKLEQNYDVVVLVFSSELRTSDYTELQRQLRQLFLDAGLYK